MSDIDPFEYPKWKEIDWTLCCLCQKKSATELRCPYKKVCYHNAYQTLEDDLKNFVENDVPLLFGVNLECINDGSGIANTLLKNEAKYHHGCRGCFRSHIVQRALDKRAREESDSEDIFSPKKTRSSFSATLNHDKIQCVCCQKFQDDSDEQLIRVTTKNCGNNLLKYATESKNWVVHARLNTAFDAIAADMYYHLSCITQMKNNARSVTAAESKASNEKKDGKKQEYDPLVIAQLVAFVQFNHSTFKLADLRRLYDRRLEQLNSDWIGMYVHQSRFKEHLLKKLGPDWSEYPGGRGIYISHTKKTVGAALAQTADLQVTEDEAKKIVEVGVMLRKYILLPQKPFNGSFNLNCLSEPVPKTLLTLLDVLLQGSSSIEEKVAEDQVSIRARVKVACTISQLICSNAAKQTSNALTLYQRKERETPFPLYMGLKLHANDRQKMTISTFHALGISVSYDRVMDVRRGLALSVSRRFAEDGVVVPSNIKRGVFTTGGVDNIDESGRIELHGTAISLTNHLTRDNMGVATTPLTMDVPKGSTVIKLPDDFAIVPYIDEYAGAITLSSIPNETGMPAFTKNPRTGVAEEAWLKHLHNVITEKDEKLQEMPVTYSGFFSHGQCTEDVRPRATVGVFPIFYEKASTMAMQKHSMVVVKKAIEFVNPGQVPVIEGDCPLYAQQ